MTLHRWGLGGWGNWQGDGARGKGKQESETWCRTCGPDGSLPGVFCQRKVVVGRGFRGGRQVEAGVWLGHQVFPATQPRHQPIGSSCSGDNQSS